VADLADVGDATLMAVMDKLFGQPEYVTSSKRTVFSGKRCLTTERPMPLSGISIYTLDAATLTGEEVSRTTTLVTRIASCCGETTALNGMMSLVSVNTALSANGRLHPDRPTETIDVKKR